MAAKEVGRCRTRGESQESEATKYPGFATKGTHHQKSKTGILEAPQTGLMSSKKNS